MGHSIRVRYHQPQVNDDVDLAVSTLQQVGSIPPSLARGLYNATLQNMVLGFELNPSFDRMTAELQVKYLQAAGWVAELVEIP